jgi:hypothetical protein
MNLLAAIFALQEQELHYKLVGVAVVDLALQEDDPVFQQQIAEGELALPLIIAVGQPGLDHVGAGEIAHEGILPI